MKRCDVLLVDSPIDRNRSQSLDFARFQSLAEQLLRILCTSSNNKIKKLRLASCHYTEYNASRYGNNGCNDDVDDVDAVDDDDEGFICSCV